MNFTVIIPSRYASTRLPAKALQDIHGKPMIQRVYECAAASAAKKIIVATDDERIAAIIEKIGGQVCFTNPNHANGTLRIVEVVKKLNFADDEIVVNLQGDEPAMAAENINQVAKNLMQHHQAHIATLVRSAQSEEEIFNPSMVKVACDQNSFAAYFSRAPIPYPREITDINNYLIHMGLYAYRVGVLKQWPMLSVSMYEIVESLEQLRALWHGCRIHIERACVITPEEVNTEEDLQRIRQWFAKHASAI